MLSGLSIFFLHSAVSNIFHGPGILGLEPRVQAQVLGSGCRSSRLTPPYSIGLDSQSCT